MSSRQVAVGLLVLTRLLPGGLLHQAPTVCPIRLVTGRPCPACGLTRSWQATTHGRLREGLRWHPMGPLTVAGAIWLAVDDAAGGRLERVGRPVQAALAAAWVATWLWRLRAGWQPVGTPDEAGELVSPESR
jgi:Protein of unknown function (DUF2752)